MFAKFASVLILAGAIGFANTAAAGPWSDNASAAWGQDAGHGHWKPARQGAPRRILERRIDRRVKNTVLPLRRMFGLGRDYAGYRVRAVIVKLRPVNRRGRVKLLVNGRAVDGRAVRRAGIIRLRLDGNRTIGRDLRRLQLDVRGKVFVKSIKIKMTRVPDRRHAAAANRPADYQIDRRAAERIAQLILRQIYDPWRNR